MGNPQSLNKTENATDGKRTGMKDDERNDQSPCCGDSDCCKPTATDGGDQ